MFFLHVFKSSCLWFRKVPLLPAVPFIRMHLHMSFFTSRLKKVSNRHSCFHDVFSTWKYIRPSKTYEQKQYTAQLEPYVQTWEVFFSECLQRAEKTINKVTSETCCRGEINPPPTHQPLTPKHNIDNRASTQHMFRPFRTWHFLMQKQAFSKCHSERGPVM
jgi:hypothetical protein